MAPLAAVVAEEELTESMLASHEDGGYARDRHLGGYRPAITQRLHKNEWLEWT
jgi:hypothetical protein